MRCPFACLKYWRGRGLSPLCGKCSPKSHNRRWRLLHERWCDSWLVYTEQRFLVGCLIRHRLAAAPPSPEGKARPGHRICGALLLKLPKACPCEEAEGRHGNPPDFSEGAGRIQSANGRMYAIQIHVLGRLCAPERMYKYTSHPMGIFRDSGGSGILDRKESADSCCRYMHWCVNCGTVSAG